MSHITKAHKKLTSHTLLLRRFRLLLLISTSESLSHEVSNTDKLVSVAQEVSVSSESLDLDIRRLFLLENRLLPICSDCYMIWNYNLVCT